MNDTVRKALAKIETVDSKITSSNKAMQQSIDLLEMQVSESVKMPQVKTEVSRAIESRISDITSELATKQEIRSRFGDLEDTVTDLQS